MQSYTKSLEKCSVNSKKICKFNNKTLIFGYFSVLIKQIVTLKYLFLLYTEINLCYLRCRVTKDRLQLNQCHFPLTILTRSFKDCPPECLSETVTTDVFALEV